MNTSDVDSFMVFKEFFLHRLYIKATISVTKTKAANPKTLIKLIVKVLGPS